MLDLARSNLAYPAQVIFLGLNAVGTVFGLAYNSKTPDLYRGSVHPTIGWTLVAIAVSQILVRVLRSYMDSRSTKATPVEVYHEEEPLVSSSADWNRLDQRHSEDASYRGPSNIHRPPFLNEKETYGNGSTFQKIHRTLGRHYRIVLNGRYHKNAIWTKSEFKLVGPMKFDSIMGRLSAALSIVSVVLTFVAICTGVVTMTGIFVSCMAPFLYAG